MLDATYVGCVLEPVLCGTEMCLPTSQQNPGRGEVCERTAFAEPSQLNLLQQRQYAFASKHQVAPG